MSFYLPSSQESRINVLILYYWSLEIKHNSVSFLTIDHVSSISSHRAKHFRTIKQKFKSVAKVLTNKVMADSDSLDKVEDTPTTLIKSPEKEESKSQKIIDLSGAAIQGSYDDKNPSILLPNQREDVCHCAIDIGGRTFFFLLIYRLIFRQNLSSNLSMLLQAHL